MVVRVFCPECNNPTKIRDDYHNWLKERKSSGGNVRYTCNKCTFVFYGTSENFLKIFPDICDKNGCV